MFNLVNNVPQLQLRAPELSAAMTGSQVVIGALIGNPCKIIFDNQGTSSVAITSSQLGTANTWHTFPSGEAIILDNDLEAFPIGTIFYGTGASGTFSISYTYIKAS
jgi:predicted glutamine amidotransferase